MPTFAELKATADSPELVRKSLQGVGFLAPMSEALPDTLLDTDNVTLAAFTEAWFPVGIVGTDGYVFSSDINKVETEGWGYSVPIRSDIDKAPKQVKFTPLERQRRQLQELILSTDLSAVTANANGEVVWEEPELPEPGNYRMVTLFMDGTAAKPFFRGKGFSKVTLAETGDETWSGDESAAGQEITVDVGIGPEGWPVRHYMGGAAFDAETYGYQPAVTP